MFCTDRHDSNSRRVPVNRTRNRRDLRSSGGGQAAVSGTLEGGRSSGGNFSCDRAAFILKRGSSPDQIVRSAIGPFALLDNLQKFDEPSRCPVYADGNKLRINRNEVLRLISLYLRAGRIARPRHLRLDRLTVIFGGTPHLPKFEGILAETEHVLPNGNVAKRPVGRGR